MRYPNIINAYELPKWMKTCQAGLVQPDGSTRWVPARLLGFASLGSRLRATWMVFTGRADALHWPGQ